MAASTMYMPHGMPARDRTNTRETETLFLHVPLHRATSNKRTTGHARMLDPSSSLEPPNLTGPAQEPRSASSLELAVLRIVYEHVTIMAVAQN